MKVSICLSAIASIVCLSAQAQVAGSSGPNNPVLPPDEPEYHVAERGPHHRVWERVTYEPSPFGVAVPRVHRYTELATGMHYLKDGGWIEAREEIEAFPRGAVARQGQIQVIFANNLATVGAIDMQAPDGKRLRSQILGLGYYETTTGKNVIIAEVKDCQGAIAAPNQVIYDDAFTGVSASVRYIYTRSAFEQDVILHSQLPKPEEFGLDPEHCVLQVLTEFLDPVEPGVLSAAQRFGSGEGVEDEDLDFGALKVGRGRAFSLRPTPSADEIPVSKQWLNQDGRHILLEQVPVPALDQQMQALPKTEGASVDSPGKAVRRLASSERILPLPRAAKTSSTRMRLASLERPSSGFVLDYIAMAVSATNYVFQSDSTYYISGSVQLSGTNIWEGCTVLKYAPNGSIGFSSGSRAVFSAGPYRPVVFTAKDDNTVGETIGGSTGNPVGYYGSALSLPGGSNYLANARFAYSSRAIQGAGSFNDIQFVSCQLGIAAASTVRVRNALFANVGNCFFMNTPPLGAAENVTFSGSSCVLFYGSPASASFALTNCVLANVTNLVSGGGGGFLVGNCNGFYNSATFGSNPTSTNGSPFQAVGAGSFYLAPASCFRNVGDININPALLAELGLKTTYPPILYSNVTFSNDLTLSPQAQRDTDIPDLGYHYEPLDYLFGGCTASANLTLSAGTAAGWFRTTSGWTHAGQAIRMDGAITVSFNGTASSPAYWVRLNTVQEQDNTAGYGHGSIENWSGPAVPVVRGRFLRCSAMAGENFNGYFADDYGGLQAEMTHTEFWSGALGNYGDNMYYTNCLMHRLSMAMWASSPTTQWVLRNCTLLGGSFALSRSSSGGLVSVRDCAFDGTSISTGDYWGGNAALSDYDYNAYTNVVDPFSIGGANDVKGVAFNWQSNWLGDYYLPSDSLLIDKGWVTAGVAGLYHFTTQTNQQKELNSQVDIGYHYVAVDAGGNPVDSDSDGMPDYLEDANGNGRVDSGETNWQDPLDLGLQVIITHPKNNSVLP